MFSTALLVLAAAVSPALATIYVTSPTASSQWTAGQQQTISWQDDGQSPSLANFGPSKVSVYVGNQIQQTPVQVITQSVDVSTTSSIVFTPDASTGQNGQYYFIRFESLGLKDATNAAFPALAFSSKYTMSGMTGTFTAEELAQISAAVSSGAAATTSAAASNATPAGTTTTSATASKITTSKAVSGTSSAASSTASTSKSNGASTLPLSALTGVAGVAVAMFAAMYM
ncbi:hypothetical protein BD309DRAFT_970729 [Dichomitus squalens]|nr:hypothetical protein BD309DRAFT_970729 [Dichomitus squalens]